MSETRNDSSVPGSCAMKIECLEKRDETALAALLAVWESSVRATHAFLSEPDIAALRPQVLEGLRGIETLCVTEIGGEPVGFLGTAGEKIEMLFVSAGFRGAGLGKRLLVHAMEDLGCRALDVNEQNPQAAGFYEHFGFEVEGRSELDGQGNPFPILHMRLPRGSEPRRGEPREERK